MVRLPRPPTSRPSARFRRTAAPAPRGGRGAAPRWSAARAPSGCRCSSRATWTRGGRPRVTKAAVVRFRVLDIQQCAVVFKGVLVHSGHRTFFLKGRAGRHIRGEPRPALRSSGREAGEAPRSTVTSMHGRRRQLRRRSVEASARPSDSHSTDSAVAHCGKRLALSLASTPAGTFSSSA